MALTTIDDRGLKTPIDLLDNEKIRFGTGNDLEIFHDNSNSYVKDTGTGMLRLMTNGTEIELTANSGSEYLARFIQDGASELYHNGSKKIETTSAGVSVTGDFSTSGDVKITGDGAGCKLEIGASSDLQAYHNGGHNYLDSLSTAELRIRVKENESAIIAKPDGAVELYNNNVKSFETHANGITVYGPEAGAAQILLHADEGDNDSDKARITVNDGGDLYIQNYKQSAWETDIKAVPEGTVELYYDNSNKLQTISTGVQVNGNLNVPTGDVQLNDNKKLRLGNSQDLDIYHDGSHSYIKDTGASHLKIENDNIRMRNGAGDELMFTATVNDSVSLYYDNTKRFETTSSGAMVSGNLVVSTGNTINTGDSQGQLTIQPGPSYPGGSIKFAGGQSGATDRGTIIFYAGETTSLQERVRIDSSGNVGIGCSPATVLHPVGTTRINQSSTLGHGTNAGTMLEVRGNAIGDGVVDNDYFKGFKIALNDQTEWGGQAQFAVGRWQDSGNSARSSLMISLGHGQSNSSTDADTDVMLLTSDGQVEIKDGNLKIGTLGHGIDFSATADGSGTTSNELLDDYEEGSFTPTLPNGGNMGVYNASYTKVGRLVSYWIYVYPQSVPNDADNFIIGGFPFTSANTSNLSGSCVMAYGATFDWTGMGWFMNINSTNMTTYSISGAINSGGSVPNSSITGATRYLALSGQYYTNT